MEEKYRIDPELNAVLPELSEEDYSSLEKSLLTDGYKGAPIMVWNDVIVDGHNRYEICNRHHIPYEVKQIDFENKEEAMRWMVRQQIGRRNLTPIQRIRIAEKYRPFYKEKAKKNKSANGGNKKSELKNSAKPISEEQKIDVRAKCAELANVSADTYSKGKKILDSGNEELIEQTLKGEKSINKAYNELKASQKKESIKMKKSTDSSVSKSELQDLKLENASHNSNSIEMVKQIQKRYGDYLIVFQNDIECLLSMEFYKNNEEVTDSIHSDLRNCLERFKRIDDLIKRMTVDDLGCIVIDK